MGRVSNGISQWLRAKAPACIARRFARQNDGAAAVEFALVATPFLALVFAIMETALVFFAGQTLEAAVTNSSRLILTGQAQTSGLTQSTFKDQVCAQIVGLFDCQNNLYVNVQKYTNFSSASTTPPYNNGQLDTTAMQYSPGGPSDIVVVSLYYQWPIYVSLLSNNLANQNGSKRLLIATAAFRNEPYQ
ncbi:MAG: TadE/TadG family type IV pilus assembly protein [Pseudolabrys sp.]